MRWFSRDAMALAPGFCLHRPEHPVRCDFCGENVQVLELLCPEPKDFPTNAVRICYSCFVEELDE